MADRRYLATDGAPAGWYEEHQKKMRARTKKRRENAKLREKGRHPVTKDLWEYVEREGRDDIIDLVKTLDMELWRTEGI